jgi:hypothetical protein
VSQIISCLVFSYVHTVPSVYSNAPHHHNHPLLVPLHLMSPIFRDLGPGKNLSCPDSAVAHRLAWATLTARCARPSSSSAPQRAHRAAACHSTRSTYCQLQTRPARQAVCARPPPCHLDELDARTPARERGPSSRPVSRVGSAVPALCIPALRTPALSTRGLSCGASDMRRRGARARRARALGSPRRHPGAWASGGARGRGRGRLWLSPSSAEHDKGTQAWRAQGPGRPHARRDLGVLEDKLNKLAEASQTPTR